MRRILLICASVLFAPPVALGLVVAASYSDACTRAMESDHGDLCALGYKLRFNPWH